jgi:hypothetical protein
VHVGGTAAAFAQRSDHGDQGADKRRSMGVHPTAVMGEGSTGKQRMSSGSGEQGAEEQRCIAPTGGGVASNASRASQTSYNELMIRVFQNN